MLVNAARGGIVDEAALYDALKTGRIGAAGLDVFAQEPCTDSPLFEPGERRRHPAPRRLHRRGPGEGWDRRREVGPPGPVRRAWSPTPSTSRAGSSPRTCAPASR
ncbi:NAD(P)-dependent oxidoreductase [Nocardioides convexus]|uniref:NAD(P)-dependent oxidoreductase n=1 Tax=Nocardioides convexus TaxID=2712224 RepID=UPI002418A527|nr:NAD(P)-dependent oxidoreductase [Nocardioides convexus]